MLSDDAIRDRFLICLTEVLDQHTQASVAETIGTTNPYLTKLKTADNPQIPVLIIARFCQQYQYSPFYILLGKGDRRGGVPDPAEKKDIYYLRIIENLTNALPKGKAKKLVEEIRKRRQ